MSSLNLTILSMYLATMLAIGWRISRTVETTEDFFLAGRRMPWLAVAMSMFASLTSAVTFMGLPGISFGGNITLVAVAVVSPVLAPVLMYSFYPLYMANGYRTSYDYIEARFGEQPRKIVAILFLLARLGWMGTVIYAPALALSLATGLHQSTCILIIGAFATLYTTLGGMRAVIWTDVAQFIILTGGALWILISLCISIPGGVVEIWAINRSAGQARLSLSWDVTEMTLGIVFISFFFQMMQDYGTDQVTVQRLLSSKNLKGVRKAVAFNAFTDTVMISLLLFLGMGLYAYASLNPGWMPEALNGDQVLPFYILNNLPNGISGLVIAGIFAAAMSSVDSGINSMATVITHDVLGKDSTDDQKAFRIARTLTWVLGVVATGVAFYVARIEGIIENFARFMSLFSAPVLALFLYGMVYKHARFSAWLAGTAVSIPYVWWIQNHSDVSWVYFFPLSLGICFAVTLASSYIGKLSTLVWNCR